MDVWGEAVRLYFGDGSLRHLGPTLLLRARRVVAGAIRPTLLTIEYDDRATTPQTRRESPVTQAAPGTRARRPSCIRISAQSSGPLPEVDIASRHPTSPPRGIGGR